MEILEVKSTITKTKTSMWRAQSNESVNFEIEQQKLTNPKKQRENRLEKIVNRTLGPCEI